jgi:hypothetical protein
MEWGRDIGTILISKKKYSRDIVTKREKGYLYITKLKNSNNQYSNYGYEHDHYNGCRQC